MPVLVISLPATSFVEGEPCFLGKSALSGARSPLLRENFFPGSFVIVKDALRKMEIARVVIVDSTDYVTVNWFRPVNQDLVADYRFFSDLGLAEVKEIAQSLMFDQIPVSFIIQYALVLSPVFIQEGVRDFFGIESVYLLHYRSKVDGGYRNIDNQLVCLPFASD
jgi:hypothetical protein